MVVTASPAQPFGEVWMRLLICAALAVVAFGFSIVESGAQNSTTTVRALLSEGYELRVIILASGDVISTMTKASTAYACVGNWNGSLTKLPVLTAAIGNSVCSRI